MANKRGGRHKIPNTSPFDSSEEEIFIKDLAKKETKDNSLESTKPIIAAISFFQKAEVPPKEILEELFMCLRNIEIQLKSYISIGPITKENLKEAADHAQAFQDKKIVIRNPETTKNYEELIPKVIEQILLLNQKFAYMYPPRIKKLPAEGEEGGGEIISDICENSKIEEKLKSIEHIAEKLEDINKTIPFIHKAILIITNEITYLFTKRE